LEQYHGRNIHLTEALTIEANCQIDLAVAEGRPFYLYMSHYAIHAPWEKDDRFYQKYVDAGLNEFHATYASMIEGMDRSLGDILANVKRLGVERDTVVVFLSDNGQPSQAARNLPLRGHKLTPYEGGVRVPMIVKWPGVATPGSVCNDYVIVEDVFPSVLEMAGVSEYRQIGGTIDGVSFIPLLKREAGHPRGQRAIFWHFPHTYDQPPYSAVRQGNWKLIYHHADPRLELFDLNVDIGEQNDLKEAEPAKLREMAGVLSEFLRRTDARLPIEKATGKQIAYPDELLG